MAKPFENMDDMNLLQEFIEEGDSSSIIAPEELETFQKEVTIISYNLWQCVKCHEDDIREILKTLKEMSGKSGVGAAGVVAVNANNSGGSDSGASFFAFLSFIIAFITLAIVIYGTFFRAH